MARPTWQKYTKRNFSDSPDIDPRPPPNYHTIRNTIEEAAQRVWTPSTQQPYRLSPDCAKNPRWGRRDILALSITRPGYCAGYIMPSLPPRMSLIPARSGVSECYEAAGSLVKNRASFDISFFALSERLPVISPFVSVADEATKLPSFTLSSFFISVAHAGEVPVATAFRSLQKYKLMKETLLF